MYYGMITAAAFLFSLQFLFNDGYQKETGNNGHTTLLFSLYTSVVGLCLTLLINGFRLRISVFSALVALAYGLVCMALNYCAIKALKYANLSVFSIFSMVGGMLLPFLYGVVCGEEPKATRWVCCALIAVSVMMTANKSTGSKKALKYYIGVFILNGMVGVISKFHQSFSSLCVDSASFLMLTKVMVILLSIGAILFSKERSFGVSRKAFAYCAGYAGFNSIGNLMLLIALFHLPASLQYPIVTGGVIVFSTVIDLLRKTTVTKAEMAAAVIAFAASALMVL